MGELNLTDALGFFLRDYPAWREERRARKELETYGKTPAWNDQMTKAGFPGLTPAALSRMGPVLQTLAGKQESTGRVKTGENLGGQRGFSYMTPEGAQAYDQGAKLPSEINEIKARAGAQMALNTKANLENQDLSNNLVKGNSPVGSEVQLKNATGKAATVNAGANLVGAATAPSFGGTDVKGMTQAIFKGLGIPEVGDAIGGLTAVGGDKDLLNAIAATMKKREGAQQATTAGVPGIATSKNPHKEAQDALTALEANIAKARAGVKNPQPDTAPTYSWYTPPPTEKGKFLGPNNASTVTMRPAGLNQTQSMNQFDMFQKQLEALRAFMESDTFKNLPPDQAERIRAMVKGGQ